MGFWKIITLVLAIFLTAVPNPGGDRKAAPEEDAANLTFTEDHQMTTEFVTILEIRGNELITENDLHEKYRFTTDRADEFKPGDLVSLRYRNREINPEDGIYDLIPESVSPASNMVQIPAR